MDRMNLCEANPNLKLVFVSMSHGEAVAQKFVKMGIPHVIAIANAEKVKNQNAISFTAIFYESFLSNMLTLQAAFNGAVEYIDVQGILHKIIIKNYGIFFIHVFFFKN